MSRKPFIAWLCSVACLLIAGCGGVSLSLLFFDEFPHDEVHPLPFQEVLPAFDSAIGERRLVVVRDLVAWDSLWREHTAGLLPQPPMPPINFAQNMVIAIFAGARSDPCLTMQVQSIWQHTHPGRIEVNYRELPIMPNAQGQCRPGLRNAAVLVTLQYSFLPVEFFRIVQE